MPRSRMLNLYLTHSKGALSRSPSPWVFASRGLRLPDVKN